MPPDAAVPGTYAEWRQGIWPGHSPDMASVAGLQPNQASPHPLMAARVIPIEAVRVDAVEDPHAVTAHSATFGPGAPELSRQEMPAGRKS